MEVKKRPINNSLASILTVPLLLMFGGSGCAGGGGGDDGVDCEECLGETGEDKLYMCGCDINEDDVYCNPNTAFGTYNEEQTCWLAALCLSPEAADEECADSCAAWDLQIDVNRGYNHSVGEIACSIYDPEGGCTGWAPSSNISYSAGTYYVDDTWLASTAATPAPLWTCDDAYIEFVAGGFDVHDASSGEALYQLGLRNGDVIQSINGLSLSTYTDAMLAWAYLYWSGTTSYALTITRNSVPMTLYYVIS